MEESPPIFSADIDELPSVPCNDYDIAQINSKVNQLNSSSILVLNIRSLRRNFAHLETFLATLKFMFSIIVLTEVWLTSEIDFGLNIPGYKTENLYRTSHGGGIKVYYRENIILTRIDLMTYINSNIELLSLNISIANLSYKLLCIYRPPSGSMVEFNNDLENNILPYFLRDYKLLMCGDINMNLFNPYRNCQIENYKNILLGRNFFPIINKATHYTPNNPITKFSLIDQIWSNFICGPIIFSGTINYMITDHLPIFLSWSSVNSDNEQTIRFRNTNCETSKIRFFNSIRNMQYRLLNSLNPCLLLKNFVDTFYNLYYECFPIKYKKRKTNMNKPWLSTELKFLIEKKHRLLRELKKGRLYERPVRSYCKILSRVIKMAKESHQLKKMNELKKSSRRMWRELNNLMGRNKQNQELLIKHNGKTLKDHEAACHMNNYFTTVATEIATKFPSQIAQPTVNSSRCENVCHFEPVTPVEVIGIVRGFEAKKRGMNSIQPIILQLVINLIAPFLSRIFNECIVSGIYPDVLKIARVVPLYKSGDPYSPSNYRPISTLCIFNKIFEKIIHSRLITFLDSNSILSQKQFGFKNKTSTTHAIFTLISEIQQSFWAKTFTTCLFLDLKKAFDTVNRELLLRKLDHYGIRGNVNSLLRSYLDARMQYVNVSHATSSTLPVPIGVVQGSVLGPLLFNIFINDIAQLGVNCVLFADDAVFFTKSRLACESITLMQNFITTLSSWLTDNRLTANENKTKVMLFSPCNLPSPMPTLSFNGTPLEWVDEFRYLGVYIDNKLRFKKHIEMVTNKLSIIQGITHSLKKQLPVDCLRTIFFSLAFPHIIQSIIIWGGAPDTTIRPIAIKMNKILRNILKIRYDNNGIPAVPTNAIYKRLSILKFADIYEYNLIKFIKTCKDDDNLIWNNYFRPLEPSHGYNVREAKLRPPNVRTEVEKRGPIFQCVRAFNNIPDSIDLNISTDLFKIKYKNQCLSQY